MTDLEMRGLRYLVDEVRLCRCGVRLASEVLLEFLRAHSKDGKANATDRKWAIDKNLEGREDIGILTLLFMDRAGLTEHGGNVRSSWLSYDGEAVLAFLEKHGVDPDKWPEVSS